jgi:hypothetical protein
MGQFVLLGLRAEAQLVDVVNDFAQVVAALNLVLDLPENLADLVFDGVRAAGLLLEAVKIGEELAANKVAKIIASLRLVVINLAVLGLGRGPFVSAVGLVEEEGVLFPLEGGFIGFVLLERVEVFQEEEPGGLLGVVQLGGADSLFAEDIVQTWSEGL